MPRCFPTALVLARGVPLVNSPAQPDVSDVDTRETSEGLRHAYMVAAVATSLLTKLAPLGPLTYLARCYGHDVALAVLGYMILRPQFSRLSSGLIIFAACSTAEVLQLLIKLPRGRRLPFLGTFDWWDFVAYGAGIAIAVLLDVATLRTSRTDVSTEA